MSTEELGYILKMPVPCPHCLQESEQTVAFLINNENFRCPECGGMVDLASEIMGCVPAKALRGRHGARALLRPAAAMTRYKGRTSPKGSKKPSRTS
jgi:hypothetical protein